MRIFRGLAAMSLMLMLAACGGGVLKTVTYTANQTVTLPAYVTNLESVAGKGQDGIPANDGAYGYTTTVVTTRYDAADNQISQETAYPPPTYNATAPADYCNGSNGSNGTRTETCYYFSDFDTSEPATDGDNATGFGKTFPGGVGGPAAAVSFFNVPVAGGQAYTLFIPPGGYITISYYE